MIVVIVFYQNATMNRVQYLFFENAHTNTNSLLPEPRLFFERIHNRGWAAMHGVRSTPHRLWATI